MGDTLVGGSTKSHVKRPYSLLNTDFNAFGNKTVMFQSKIKA